MTLATAEEITDAMDLGYALRTPRGIYIPVILFDERGQGKGGEFLDQLPTDQRIVVPAILNPILVGMLERRGFVPTWEWAEEFGEVVECYVRWSDRKPTREAAT